MKPSLGSAIGRDSLIKANAEVTVRSGFWRRRYAIVIVTERDLPIALKKILVKSEFYAN
jgi:tRNA U34 5-methylaminomethyl-2-thiouridine-forming methyltransferase MnmC